MNNNKEKDLRWLVKALDGRRKLTTALVDGPKLGAIAWGPILILLLLYQFEVFHFYPALLWTIPIIVCLLSGVWIFMAPGDPGKNLLLADKVYKQNELLTTAWHLSTTTDSPTVLKKAVLQKAGQMITIVRKESLYPLRYRLLILFLLLSAAGSLLAFSNLNLRNTFFPEDDLSLYGNLLKEDARSLIESTDNQNSRMLFRKMEDLGREMEEELLSRDEVREELKELAAEMEQQLNNLARLPENHQLDDAPLNETQKETLDKMGRGESSQSEAMSLKQELLESDEIDPNAKNQIEDAYGDYQDGKLSQEDLSNAIADAIGEKEANPEADAMNKGLEELKNLMESLGDEESPVAEGGKTGEGDREESTPTPEQDGDVATSGNEEQFTEGDAQDEPGENPGSNPGIEDDNSKEKEPEDLELPNRQDNVSQLKGESLDLDKQESFIRSLPEGGESTLEESIILQDYQKILDEVSTREDIPLSLKEYIKDYFLNIRSIQENEAGQ